MILNLNLKWLLPLIATIFATTSCQVTNSIKHQAGKQPQEDLSNNDIGDGAVASQQDLKSWPEKEFDLCVSKANIPSEEQQFADKSNFGSRDSRDYLGRRLASRPRFVVIHETVMGERDTISLFKTSHPNDNDQVSYHMLVARDGRLIRIVPDKNRAYGAGMSHFMGSTLRAKENSAGSINNVALHISLVSPPGFEQSDSHTGYTEKQYSTLAKQILKWQMQYGIPMSRVTTHYAVDRSHSRYDPRSFHWTKFDNIHISLTTMCNLQEFQQPTS